MKKLFAEIWAEREHRCEISDEPIWEAKAQNFMHILSRNYPKFKYDKRNIILAKSELHHLYDNDKGKAKKDPRFDWVFEEAEKLRQEYHKQYKK